MPRPHQDPPDHVTFVRPDTGEEVTLEVQPMSRWDRRPAMVDPHTGAKTPLVPANPVWMLLSAAIIFHLAVAIIFPRPLSRAGAASRPGVRPRGAAGGGSSAPPTRHGSWC